MTIRPLPGDAGSGSFFHMEIESVRRICWPRFPPIIRNIFPILERDGVRVKTTGARFDVTRKGVTLIRRIDTRTNKQHGRLVGRIRFPRGLGRPRIQKHVGRAAEITVGETLALDFKSDSLFFVKNTSPHPVSYEYQSLVIDAPWNKRDDAGGRMWTDGNGGTLHALLEGASMLEESLDASRIRLEPSGEAMHMVFPPRPFDFDALYRADAKPFHQLTGNRRAGPDAAYQQLERHSQLEQTSDPGWEVRRTWVLWNMLYIDHSCRRPPCRPFPMQLGDAGQVGYAFDRPLEVAEAIARFHAKHQRVIAYVSITHNTRRHEISFSNNMTIDRTVHWLRSFRNEYQLDGYYLDGPGYGVVWQDNWLNTYIFIRALRDKLGDDAILVNHDSVDVWGAHRGLRAVMVNAYCNYQRAGESFNERFGGNEDEEDTAVIDHPDENYLRYFTSGYGISQAICAHTMENKGRGALSRDEKIRVLVENLNGIDNSYRTARQYYDAVRSARLDLGGTKIDWPPAWYKRLEDLERTEHPLVNLITFELTERPPELKITWTTPEPSHSSVAFARADRKFWKTGSGRWEPDDLIASWTADMGSGKTKQHAMTVPVEKHLTYLKVGELSLGYGSICWLRVRSWTAETVAGKVWGHVRNFRVATNPLRILPE